MSRVVRVGMGQMLVEPGRLEANLERATAMVAGAAEAGCDVVVLPETFDLGWMHESTRTLAEAVPGEVTGRLSDAARDHGIHVVAGVSERAADRFYNAAVLISGSGQILAHHRKINELDFAQELYSTGTSLHVVDTDLGRLGVNVCADNFANAKPLGQALGAMGAEMLLSPSAWAVHPDHDNDAVPFGHADRPEIGCMPWVASYQALAAEYRMPTVGVSNVGPIEGGRLDGWRCIGSSLAVDRDGEVALQGPYGVDAEGLLTVDLTVGRD